MSTAISCIVLALNILGEGNLVGELSIIDRQKQSARVTCIQDVNVLSVAGRDFVKIVESNPSVASRLLRELAKRIRTGNDNVVRKLEDPGGTDADANAQETPPGV